MRPLWLVLVLAGCDRLWNLDYVAASDGKTSDALPQLVCTTALTAGAYPQPQSILAGYGAASFTRDVKQMYVARNGALFSFTFAGTWTSPTEQVSLEAPGQSQDHPRLSYDGLHIFYTRVLSGTSLPARPYEAVRETTLDAWSNVRAVEFPAVIGSDDVKFGVPMSDGTRVVAAYGSGGHYHLTELLLVGSKWTLLDTMAALYPAGSDLSDNAAQLSPDGCSIVFGRLDRTVSTTDHDLMFSNRRPDGTFAPPEKLLTNTSTIDEAQPWFDFDTKTVYFTSGTAVFQSARQ